MPVVSPLSHRRVDLVPQTPGVVAAVETGSLADELGIAAGDRIVAVNGRPVEDALDFQFHAQAERVDIELERGGARRRLQLRLEGDEFWGVTFGDPSRRRHDSGLTPR